MTARLRALSLALLLAACTSTVPGEDPVGRTFPSVSGTTASEERLELPGALTGRPSVVLFGYDARSQFDQDRWVTGLRDLGVDVPVVQLAASGGLRASADSSWLAERERTGLANRGASRLVRLDDEDVRPLAELFGNVDEQRARVAVLDRDGSVVWFEDDGFSPAHAMAAADALARLGVPMRRERSTGGPVAAESVARGDDSSPVGRRFPSVSGESLAGEEVRLPEDLAGRAAVLLVGFEQEAQFDIDRWLLGLGSAGIDAHLLEVPTMPGFLANLASGWIDDGMRSGIPQEDWGAVVCLYGSRATPVAELLGREDGELARVVVLDAAGSIVGFHDRGYDEAALQAILELVRER